MNGLNLNSKADIQCLFKQNRKGTWRQNILQYVTEETIIQNYIDFQYLSSNLKDTDQSNSL